MSEFDTTKRMQLLTGSKVLCIKDVQGLYRTAFKAGNIYKVQYANNIKGDDGAGHTWSIECFRVYFKELSNSNFSYP